jgi:hypothetical protein
VRKIRDINTYKKLLDFFDRYAFLTLSGFVLILSLMLSGWFQGVQLPEYLLAAFTGISGY